MINLQAVPEHIREWFERDLLPEIEHDKTTLLTLRNLLAEHAQNALAAAQRELANAQKLAPLLGADGEAVIEAAEKGLEVAQAFVNKVTSAT